MPVENIVSPPPALQSDDEYYLYERYHKLSNKKALLTWYYRFRPLMPRSIQVGIRRWYARIQGKDAFPSWPIEAVLVHRQEKEMRLRISQSGDGRVPIINLWPGRARAAIVLTHDLESARGVENIPRVREIERRYRMVSSWNFVPERYPFDRRIFRTLKDEGCEIGVHGLYHDGKLFSSRRIFEERVPKINQYLQEWGAVGFRSPATHRNPDWMPMIEAEYDSSFPDTDPYEPQAGGCCSIFPFFLGKMVELPITMPQDHTLFEILGHSDISVWKKKATWLIENHGLVLVLTHPDYMIKEKNLEHYDELLAFLSNQPSTWHALPQDVARWWRERSASKVSGGSEHPTIQGPAAERGSITWAMLNGDKVVYRVDK
jgi:hypothetical protein